MKDLGVLRGEIDAIDTQLIALFEARMACARQVAAYKQERQMPIFDAAREAQVVATRVEKLRDKQLAPEAQALFEELMRLSRQVQACELAHKAPPDAPIAYCGVAGAYGDEACVALFGKDSKRLPLGRFEEVFIAVTSGQARFGVVPIENSSAGSVTDNYDLLGRYDCHIIGEYVLPVHHCLLALPGVKEEDIEEVYSHEQALRQCSEFLDAHPQWKKMPYYNTAASAQKIAQSGNRHHAALASRLAAEEYGLAVLQEGVNTKKDNFTRFVVVSNHAYVSEDADKATLTFTLRHERGSLHRALACFVALGMNLMRIESRPNTSSWEYRFYVDVTGNVSAHYMDVLLEALRADCLDCRLLGSYRAAGGTGDA